VFPRSTTHRSITPSRRLVWTAALVLLVALAFAGCDTSEDEAARPAVVPGEEWNEPGGRWHMLIEGPTTDEQREEIQKLRAIGYVGGSEEPPEVTGVTVYDRARALPGLNFYTSGHSPGAILMDMEGNVLHEWHYDFIDAWRTGSMEELPRSTKGAGFWRRAHLFENGDVLAIYDGMALVKVDKDSKLIWAYLEGAHHDLEVADDGTIYVLIREAHMVPRISEEHPILEDFVAIVDPDGKELRRVSLLEAFERSTIPHLLDGMKEHGDIFHTNTIELLDGSLAGRLEGFEAGNVLVCVRELDIIATVDLEREEVVWALTAPWKKPHQPTVLPNGRIMIFDNRGHSGASRVIEFEPDNGDIAWLYQGDDPADFASHECGSNVRLPNGNTLISESDGGRAFEVTPKKEIVWEYINPEHTGENNEFIASVFEMLRLPPDFPLDWIAQSE